MDKIGTGKLREKIPSGTNFACRLDECTATAFIKLEGFCKHHHRKFSLINHCLTLAMRKACVESEQRGDVLADTSLFHYYINHCSYYSEDDQDEDVHL